jgi:hypothetical protein
VTQPACLLCLLEAAAAGDEISDAAVCRHLHSTDQYVSYVTCDDKELHGMPGPTPVAGADLWYAAVAAAAAAGSSLFIWVATRQLDGLYKNCWLVEYVTPIKDPAVIKALQIGY